METERRPLVVAPSTGVRMESCPTVGVPGLLPPHAAVPRSVASAPRLIRSQGAMVPPLQRPSHLRGGRGRRATETGGTGTLPGPRAPDPDNHPPSRDGSGLPPGEEPGAPAELRAPVREGARLLSGGERVP